MENHINFFGDNRRHRFLHSLWAIAVLAIGLAPAIAQSDNRLTPLQRQIERERQRLSSSSEEDRQDAVMRLGAIHQEAASRAVLPALNDTSPTIRAVAASAVLALPPDESVSALLPLLNDKDEFVRREAAYALGHTRNRRATSALTERLLTDKQDGVRAAAAVALAEIGDDSTVVQLSNVLAPQLSKGAKGKTEKNSFVLRSVAMALGHTRSRAGIPALTAALSDEKLDSDVRREAARSLGLIGDPAALPALRSASTSNDPYLATIANQAINKLSR